MKNWTETTKRFVNPYNFVPLESKCERKPAEEYWKGYKASELLTGYMDCTLTTLTPLIIPNTSNDKALNAEKDTASNSYDFYSYANLENKKKGFTLENYHEPVIPGSELRGVIRSVYEAAFNGCMSVVNGDRVLHRRVKTPKEKAGVLQWNKQDNSWEIIECERVMLYVDKGKYKDFDKHKFGAKVGEETYNGWNEGQVIFIKKANEAYKTSRGFDTKFHVADDFKEVDVQEKGWKKGYLHKGEPFSKKHHESVFVLKSMVTVVSVDPSEIERLQIVLDQYGDATMNKNLGKSHTGHKEYSGMLKKLMNTTESENFKLPVYYSLYEENKVKKATYLTPAMISKEVFRTKIGGLLHEHGEYEPCDSRERVCPACALFGMVGASGDSLGSRIRFSDAKHQDRLTREWEDVYLKNDIELPELGEPKPGTAEFYTLPPIQSDSAGGVNYNIWTYDYVDKNGKEKHPLEMSEPSLRGRKFYWHSKPKNGSDAGPKHSELKNMSMRKKVRAVKGDETFTFKIYFERITQQELVNLHWALTFGDEHCAHKIGHGKPLGYGSAKVSVSKTIVRRFDKDSGERSIEPFSMEKIGLNEESRSMTQMKKIATFVNNPVQGYVAYPQVEVEGGKGNEIASHQWFAANKEEKGKFYRILPRIEQEVDASEGSYHLHKYKKKEKKNNHRNNKL